MGSIGKGDNYVLGRNLTESMRLDGQHFLFSFQNGFTIDPIIPISPDAKIAEMGTGTGIWLLDMASQVPSTVQLDGFDISDEQFPAQSALPSNVTLQVLDSFAEMPEEHFEKYDVVHLRLWCAIIRGCDTFRLIKNATQLLKPGGYLQWEEVDHTRSRMYIKGAEVETLYSLVNMICNELGINFAWLEDLPNRVKEAGLNVLKFRMGPFSQVCIPMFTKSFIMVHMKIVDAAYKASVPSLPPRDESDAIIAAAMETVKNGATYHPSLLTLLAQKPFI
ncbi:S-adenosyl-L-methionine-dependent methyltransferase [Trichoderma barbatum]